MNNVLQENNKLDVIKALLEKSSLYFKGFLYNENSNNKEPKNVCEDCRVIWDHS